MLKITNHIFIDNSLPFTLIAGNCQIESEYIALKTAEFLRELTHKMNIPFIYKSSFDKSNRTSIEGERGVGIDDGLKILEKIKKEFGCSVLTDIHRESQCKQVASIVDIIQIPSLRSKHTDMIVSAASTGLPVHIKKGEFMAPETMLHAIEKAESTGNKSIIVSERGTMFGYNDIVVDMRSLRILKEKKYPVFFDATHSIQKPSSLNNSSGGDKKFIIDLARAAISIGVAGLYMETHPNPDEALSDGPCMMPLNLMEDFLLEIKKFDELSKSLL